MQIAVATYFLALCISAPWVSRKWGLRGAFAWGIIGLWSLAAYILFIT